jgi:hypothetical protein
MTTLQHFPFPDRNPDFTDNQIFYIKSDSPDYIDYYYNKNTSVNSITIANQYFSIEDIFLESFKFVTPIFTNKDTSSVRYATIIRESCNLYEILSRKAYFQFFKVQPTESLNIYNYLTLEFFFKINDNELRSSTFYNYLPDNRRIAPFDSLAGFDWSSSLLSSHIPKWWTAYNKIKHDSENFSEYATLDNALFSIAAVFLVIRKIYGDGLISGFLKKGSSEANINSHLYPIRNSNVFIGEIFKTGKR